MILLTVATGLGAASPALAVGSDLGWTQSNNGVYAQNGTANRSPSCGSFCNGWTADNGQFPVIQLLPTSDLKANPNFWDPIRGVAQNMVNTLAKNSAAAIGTDHSPQFGFSQTSNRTVKIVSAKFKGDPDRQNFCGYASFPVFSQVQPSNSGNTQSVSLIEGRIELPVDKTWSYQTNPGSDCGNVADTVRHEYGHILGLGHTIGSQQLMYYIGGLNGPQTGDKKGIRCMYEFKISGESGCN